MSGWEGAQLNEAKAILAYELTKLVHGEEEANKAQEGARALFGGGANTDNMPTTTFTAEEFGEGMGLLSTMVKVGVAASNSEARRLVAGNSVSLNDAKITDPSYTITKADFEKGYAILKKGKKVFHKIVVE